MSREDAVRALTRLIESNAKITEPEPSYLSVIDVGGYDRSIITDALLAAETDLPEVSHTQLPSEWKGVGLSCCKNGRHIYRDFRESDLDFLEKTALTSCASFTVLTPYASRTTRRTGG